ncbi:uncharacterized protein TNCV_4830641 [Trichonephila clavipes]|nr:uncharacterized protein TNCV_4830641 [Trichonephila clavipes]
MTFSRIWNRWVQDGNTERRAGSQRTPVTSSREDSHVIRMALMDRVATVINDEPGRANDDTSFFQVSPGSVWPHRGERALAGYIQHHTGPSPGVMLDNAQPHFARTFLDTENVWLLLWSARPPAFSPIENAKSMVAE